MSLFDNAFNINVNNVRDIQILLVKFTYWPTDGPKLVETDITKCDPFGHPYKIACI